MSKKIKLIGIIQHYNARRGYGFIRPNNGSKDIFFHIKQAKEGVSLNKGLYVSFEIGDGLKKKEKEGKNIEIVTLNEESYVDIISEE